MPSPRSATLAPTPVTGVVPTRGWLLYDGECRFCTNTANRVARLIGTRGFAILPLQTPWVRARLGLSESAPLREMIVLTHDDRRVGGADAALHLAHAFWWARPLTWLALIPGVRPLLHRGYAWIAARRSCAGGACALPHRHTRPTLVSGPLRPALREAAQTQGLALPVADWLPLVVLPLVAMATFALVPAWVFMWLLAGAIFAGCKWLTWRTAIRQHPPATTRRSIGYLFAWPGMDAAEFLQDHARVVRGSAREWFFACTKLSFGIALLALGVRAVPAEAPLLAGWVGMIGLIFVLHFGTFHLLSLAWRAAGVNAPPLMHAPLLARSLGELWGRRWNAAFHELVHRFLYRRVARRWGATGATLVVFTLSGLVHELVISVPARGGYGLPTAYFVVQGVGLWFEHSRFGRAARLGAGATGWAFTLFVAAAPAFVLFHPLFVRDVILPMLHVFGAR